ncbi:MAG: iron-containing alcohol dehydrogenase [Thermoflexales bacterium]|nr:iron-containing alcohol dehydrogenase [Thermoflexales bacterium]
MWFFKSPEIVFGEDALSYLDNLDGRRAFIVSDATISGLGYVARVRQVLEAAGFEVGVYDAVEPDPPLDVVRAGAEKLASFKPDWIVGLGGGSPMDAAKAMWVLYEHPEMDLEGISPVETIELRRKARFVAIPTTSGTGSEATWFIVLTQPAERRKLGLGCRQAVADIAIIDPSFVADMPPRLTADTGLDALTHAVEGFTCLWHNDFADGLCLKAAQLVFEYLPRAYRNGSDMEARTEMHNAASIAGLGFGNSMASLAHGMGHALGAVFHVPHGRAVSLFLPYTIEFCARGEDNNTRYAELARFLGLPCSSEQEAAGSLVTAIRRLQRELEQPLTLAGCDISRQELARELNLLAENAGNDNQAVTSPRSPDDSQMRRLFEYAYEGKEIDF